MKHCIASWGQLCARRLEVKGVQEGNVFQGICIWATDIGVKESIKINKVSVKEYFN